MSFIVVIGLLLDISQLIVFSVGIMGFPRQQKKYKIFIWSVLVCLSAFLLFTGWTDNLYIYTSMDILTIFLLVKGKCIEKVKFFLVGYLVTGIVDIVFGTIFCFITKTHLSQITDDDYRSLIISGISLVVGCGISVILTKRKKKIYSFWSELRVKEYLLILFTLFTLSCAFASMQDALYGSNSEDSKMTGLLMLGLSFILIIILESYFLIAHEKNKRLLELTALNQKNMELQKKYFYELQEKNSDLRKFRHDWQYHITTLRTYIQKGENEKAQIYIDEMLETTVQTGFIHTGNFIADALLNQIFEEDGTDKKYKLRVVGNFPQSIKIEDGDLAVLLGNLFMNAKEAVERCEDGGEISLEISNYQERIFLVLSNSYCEQQLEMTIGRTSKQDKENHGIGLQTIGYILEKYHGKMKTQIEESKYSVEVTI